MRLTDLFEAETPNRVVVVYGGRFQPFHKGHAAVYKSLCDHFGADNVWVASSNKVTEKSDDKFSPLTFDERVLFMKKLGVREDRIQQAKNPAFAPTEVFIQFKEPLAYVAAGGEKDAERYNGNKFFEAYPTENGKPLKFEAVKDKLLPLSAKRGYYLLASPQAGGLSGTQVRAELTDNDDSKRRAAFKKHFGEFDQSLYDLLQSKLKGQVKESMEPGLRDYMRKVRHDFKLRKSDLLKQARGLAPEADIVDLKLSGSYAAGNPTPKSDVDMLVYFQGNVSPEEVIDKLLGRLHSNLVGIFDVGAVKV